jgi:hypothetical protein
LQYLTVEERVAYGYGAGTKAGSYATVSRVEFIEKPS